MNIQERIMKINQIKFEYDMKLRKESIQLKGDFEQYITDKDISFKDRWNTFVRAPNELSNVVDNLSFFKLEGISEDQQWELGEIESQLIQAHITPNKDVNLKSMYLEYIDEEGNVDFDGVHWDIKNGKFSDKDIEYFILNSAEQLMKENVHSFSHDWHTDKLKHKQSVDILEALLSPT